MVKKCLVTEEMEDRLHDDEMIDVLDVKRVKRGEPSEPYEVTWKIRDEYR